MLLKHLKEQVLEANLDLKRKNLVISTWGNVSAFDEESGLVIIKASGIPYADMRIEHMTVVDMHGIIVEGDFRPSTDLATHLVIYKNFKGVKAVVHTHSQSATIWAQLGQNIPCLGTTHADYFYGPIPCTRKMLPDEIESEYEKNTGKVIIEAFQNMDSQKVPGVLVHSHGPFTWGESPASAVNNSLVLENIAQMAYCNYIMTQGNYVPIQQELLDKHYNRKFGKDAYYGQKK